MAERQSTLLKKSERSNNFVKAQAFGQGVKLLEQGFEGFSNYEAAVNSSKDLQFQAKQEKLIGAQQSLAALSAFNEAQAANIVASFASGLRLSGSITRVQTKLSRDLAFNTTLNRTNADIKAGALEREARRIKAEADYNKSMAPFKIVAGVTEPPGCVPAPV